VPAGRLRAAARQLGADRDDQRLLLAEQDGEVIAFFAIGLNIQQANTRHCLFMPGIYGDIFEVAVRENRRRGGVGTALFEAAWAWFAAQGTQAVFVNYAPTNPISSRFWPRLGFVDAWTNWWRDRR
jgi:ribosomal protein S18 acetylase RimI-like enzyme